MYYLMYLMVHGSAGSVPQTSIARALHGLAAEEGGHD